VLDRGRRSGPGWSQRRQHARLRLPPLGRVAQEQRRFAEATSCHVKAAVSWHSRTGRWPIGVLAVINGLRANLPDDEWQRSVREAAESAGEQLMSALESPDGEDEE
jgi:hypothetical protein